MPHASRGGAITTSVPAKDAVIPRGHAFDWPFFRRFGAREGVRKFHVTIKNQYDLSTLSSGSAAGPTERVKRLQRRPAVSSKVVQIPVDEQRSNTRHQVETVMPAQILDGPSERRVPCRIFDVSDDGLAILTNENLAQGATLVFVTLKQRFTFTVAWCRPEGEKEFRAGLQLADGQTNLKSVFAGYLGAQPSPRRLRAN
jgi:hypothetical protein